MNYNFHTHTPRSHHATGTPEEYVLRAIEGGILYMGFSDHFPYRFPDGREAKFRVPVDEVGDYFAEIMALREKYKDKIDIKIGFEMEYYPELFDEMLALAKGYGAEYLICGEHFNHPEYPNPRSNYAYPADNESLCEYVQNICAAIKSHVFTYIAHPDIINFVTDDAFYEKEMRKICEASLADGVPLEINFLGIRESRLYPRELFWKIAGEVGSPVTCGFDAHDVNAACDTESARIAQELIKKYNLNYIGMPKIISIR